MDSDRLMQSVPTTAMMWTMVIPKVGAVMKKIDTIAQFHSRHDISADMRHRHPEDKALDLLLSSLIFHVIQ
jgi:hypothetical protein